MASIEKIDRQPTATAMPARVRMFQPSLRPTLLTEAEIETKHGTLKITGRLGQRHAAVFEAVLKLSRTVIDPETKTAMPLVVSVEPAELRKVLSDTYSSEQLWLLMVDLLEAKVEIKGRNYHAIGSIFSGVSREHGEKHLYGMLEGQCARRWLVYIGPALQTLLTDDIRRYYNPYAVSRLTTGVAQATARYLLTHRRSHQPTGGWKVDTVIHAVCGDVSNAVLRRRRAELNVDTNGLALVGISLKEGRLSLNEATDAYD